MAEDTNRAVNGRHVDTGITIYDVMDEDTASYYVFDKLVFIKFSNDTNRYFVYDKIKEAWELDNYYITWFFGAEHEITESIVYKKS